MRACALPVLLLPLAVAGELPNIVVLIGDDVAWAGVGWHHNTTTMGRSSLEIQTPHLDALVRAGIELDHHYVYRFCSPYFCVS